ncbi:hypothetical protein WICMUC_003545 [Wickerhamomyces mucosus]|uniref:Uncharacterized protein n=1 Tax=Wickerhamomyces mucosus TaxID=1378264 RepID=A0A9P8PKQ8_9ASCO|nr:hypothetical protein WICMUC_003545 [Wickerhamomyces mucosus]
MFTSRYEEAAIESYELRDSPTRHYSEVDIEENRIGQPSIGAQRISTESTTSQILDGINRYADFTEETEFFPSFKGQLLNSERFIKIRKRLHPIGNFIHKNWVILFAVLALWLFLQLLVYGITGKSKINSYDHSMISYVTIVQTETNVVTVTQWGSIIQTIETEV